MKLIKKRKKRDLSQVNRISYLLLILFISYVVATFIERSSYSFDFLRIVNAKVIALILFGVNHGSIVELPYYGFYVEIIKDCVGWKTFIALLTLWLVAPFNIKVKGLLILASIPLAFIINLTRILLAILLVNLFNDPVNYGFYDTIVFKLFNIPLIFMVGVFLIRSLKEERH